MSALCSSVLPCAARSHLHAVSCNIHSCSHQTCWVPGGDGHSSGYGDGLKVRGWSDTRRAGVTLASTPAASTSSDTKLAQQVESLQPAVQQSGTLAACTTAGAPAACSTAHLMLVGSSSADSRAKKQQTNAGTRCCGCSRLQYMRHPCPNAGKQK